MPAVVDLQRADDPRDVIHQAVQTLSSGGTVLFPSETQYVAAALALQEPALERLKPLFGDRPAVLAVKSADELLDYLPTLSRLGGKLARRCWPGPVVLSLEPDAAGLLKGLPDITGELLGLQSRLHARVSAHEAIQETLRLLPAPLVLSPEPLSNGEPVHAANGIADSLDGRVDLILDDGPCRYGDQATVVSVDDDQWSIEQPGVVSDTTIGRLASEVYLFICTGNTCRSPMAEGLFRHLLAEKLGCTEEELLDRGFVVASAGLAAAPGYPASPESVRLLQERGIDIAAHASQQLTMELLNKVDFIFTMTRGHRDAILSEFPELAERVNLLSHENRDISDPIGGGIEEYRLCQQEIEQSVVEIVNQIAATPE